MRESLLTMVCLLMLSGTVLASPLTDYSPGKIAIDINSFSNFNANLTNNQGFNSTFTTNSGVNEFQITTGLGNKIALQYRHSQPEFTQGIILRCPIEEVNVLYQINKNLSTFVGYHGSVFEFDGIGEITEKRNTIQFGLTGNSIITDQMKLYGTVGFGPDITNYEVGLSYDIVKNAELNIFYRDIDLKKYNSLAGNGVNVSAKFSGIGYGLTLKF